MTQWGYDDNDDTQTGNTTDMNGPKALRDAYEKLKQQNEQTNQMIQELLNEKKQSQLNSVFESLGVPGAASVYQGDADPEKAKAWVESMRSVFGASQGSNPGGHQEQTPAAPPALPASMQSQFERMIQAGQEGQPVGNFEAAQAAVNDANDLSSLVRAMQQGNMTM